MKFNWLAAVAVALLGVNTAAAGDLFRVDPISATENNVGRASAELYDDGGHGACDTCDNSCDDCDSGRQWYAGVEATYLRPDFDAQTVVDIDDSNVHLNHAYEAAPRVWFGVENGNGTGIVARYWEFDSEAFDSTFDTFDQDGNNFNGLIAGSALEMYTIDLEVTKRFCAGNWNMLGSGGVRHGSIGHDFAATQFNFEDDNSIDSSNVLSSRQFDGTGLTFALGGTKQIGGSALSWFWNARGSFLWGENKATGVSLDADVDDGDVDVDSDSNDTRVNDSLFIGELQLGAEWRQALQCVDADVFVRGAFEYQFWGLDEATRIGVGADDGDFLASDLDLYGLAFAVGISR